MNWQTNRKELLTLPKYCSSPKVSLSPSVFIRVWCESFGCKIYGGCILKYNIVFMLLNILLVMETDAVRFYKNKTDSHMDGSHKTAREMISMLMMMMEKKTRWEILMRKTKMMVAVAERQKTQMRRKKIRTHSERESYLSLLLCCGDDAVLKLMAFIF